MTNRPPAEAQAARVAALAGSQKWAGSNTRGFDRRQKRLAEEILARPKVEIVWQPQPGPQTALLRCPLPEVFYGGARGGGKTDGMLGDFAQHASRHGAAAKGMFIRRRYKNLEDVIRRSRAVYGPLGATYQETTATWTFPNGATLKFRHLWDISDANDYQGHSYTWICFEEVTQWPNDGPFNLMRATLRSAEGVPTLMRATGNPGGPGHNWVKARYISPHPTGFKPLMDQVTGKERVFIPARLEDNQILMTQDPGYEGNLRLVGSAALVKAWREGNWDVVAGGFFDDVWNPQRHVLKPFQIPKTWRLRRSFDWGSAKPASLGIWAISDGTEAPDGGYFPRGSTIRVSEWYTCQEDERGGIKPNVGLRLDNALLGAGIAQRSYGKQWSGCVADPSIYRTEGGPSIYDQMRDGARKAGHVMVFNRADNSRVPGWALMRERLSNSIDRYLELPGLYVFDTCEHWIRTVPVLQRDLKKPDDIDTDAEDHAADDTRYLLTSNVSRTATLSMPF